MFFPLHSNTIWKPLRETSKTRYSHHRTHSYHYRIHPTHLVSSSSPPLPLTHLQVRTVEDHHRSRIDTLLQENTALRRRLLLKTEEFSQFRSSVEKSQRMTLNTFKERVRGKTEGGREVRTVR